MRRTILLFWLISILLTFAGGCISPATDQPEGNKVTAAQVKAFQNQKKEKRVDIYIPIKEQYATSLHSQSLKALFKKRNEIKPTCYQCMSAEYNLAPANRKPNPKDIKLSISCAVCHVLTPSEFKLRLNPLDTCTNCHRNETDIVPGAELHHTQKEMFLGYGALGVPRTPDSKYKAGLTCIECHMPNEAHTFQGKTPAEAIKEHTESICVMCHADQSEEQFARKVADMQAKIKNECENLEKGLLIDKFKINERRSQGINMDEAQQVYNIVYTNLSFIKADKSMGIHNFEYTTKIVTYSAAQKQKLEKILQ